MTEARRRARGVGNTVVHPPAHSYRVLDARRGCPGEGPGQGGCRRRSAGARDHRPRQHVRRLGLLQGVPGRGPQPGHRHGGVHGRRVPARAAGPAGQGRRHRRRRRGRPEALLPPDPAGGVDAGLPEPAQAVVRGVPRGLLLQAPGGLGAARTAPRRLDRHDRLPRRRRPPGAAGRKRGRGRAAGRPTPGHLRARQPLRRDPGPRDRRPAADQPPADRDRPPARCPVAGHQRQPLHPPRGRGRPRRPALRPDRGHLERHQPVPVRGDRALPEVGGRDAAPLRRGSRVVRQHAAHRRAGERRTGARQAEPARVPGAGRVHR